MSWLLASGGQNIGALASASVFSMNIHVISFRINWFDLLAVHKTLKSSPAPQFESISSLTFSLLYGLILTSIQDHWKNHSFDFTDLVGKVKSLLFNMLSRVVIVFLSRTSLWESLLKFS